MLALSSSRALLPRSHVLSAVSFLLLVRAHLPLSSTSSGCTTAPNRSIASRLLSAPRRAPPPTTATTVCATLDDDWLIGFDASLSLLNVLWCQRALFSSSSGNVANCERNRRTKYDDDDDDDAFILRYSHLASLTLSISPLSVCMPFSYLQRYPQLPIVTPRSMRLKLG